MGADAKLALDRFSFNPEKCWIEETTGYLHLEDVTATAEGIMPYPEAGGERRYFPAEVLKRDMLGLAYKPIAVVMHPDGNIVDINNVEEHRVGTVKAEIWFDGTIHVKAVIENQKAIDLILGRKIGQTSAGYLYWDDGQPGSNQYGNFDTTITKMVFNHLLITDLGRGGQQSRVGLDKKQQEEKIMSHSQDLNEIKIGDVVIVKQENISYDPDPAKGKSAVDTLTRRETVIAGQLQTLHNRVIELETTLESTKENLENAKKAADSRIDPDKVNELVNETIEVDKVVFGKLGLDSGDNPLVSQKDSLIAKKLQGIKKLTPKSYDYLEEKKLLDNKVAVDSAFSSAVANLDLNQEIQDIDDLYRNGQQTAGDSARFQTPPAPGKKVLPDLNTMATQMRHTQ